MAFSFDSGLPADSDTVQKSVVRLEEIMKTMEVLVSTSSKQKVGLRMIEETLLLGNQICLRQYNLGTPFARPIPNTVNHKVNDLPKLGTKGNYLYTQVISRIDEAENVRAIRTFHSRRNVLPLRELMKQSEIMEAEKEKAAKEEKCRSEMETQRMVDKHFAQLQLVSSAELFVKMDRLRTKIEKSVSAAQSAAKAKEKDEDKVMAFLIEKGREWMAQKSAFGGESDPVLSAKINMLETGYQSLIDKHQTISTAHEKAKKALDAANTRSDKLHNQYESLKVEFSRLASSERLRKVEFERREAALEREMKEKEKKLRKDLLETLHHKGVELTRSAKVEAQKVIREELHKEIKQSVAMGLARITRDSEEIQSAADLRWKAEMEGLKEELNLRKGDIKMLKEDGVKQRQISASLEARVNSQGRLMAELQETLTSQQSVVAALEMSRSVEAAEAAAKEEMNQSQVCSAKAGHAEAISATKAIAISQQSAIGAIIDHQSNAIHGIYEAKEEVLRELDIRANHRLLDMENKVDKLDTVMLNFESRHTFSPSHLTLLNTITETDLLTPPPSAIPTLISGSVNAASAANQQSVALHLANPISNSTNHTQNPLVEADDSEMARPTDSGDTGLLSSELVSDREELQSLAVSAVSAQPKRKHAGLTEREKKAKKLRKENQIRELTRVPKPPKTIKANRVGGRMRHGKEERSSKPVQVQAKKKGSRANQRLGST